MTAPPSSPTLLSSQRPMKAASCRCPPNPSPDLVPTAQDAPATWRYATDAPSAAWFQPSFDDTAWQSGQSGFGHGVGEIHTPWTTGDIWLRRTVTLPADLPASLVFNVFHDEDCEIYVNGVLAASATGYNHGLRHPADDRCRTRCLQTPAQTLSPSTAVRQQAANLLMSASLEHSREVSSSG